MTDANQQRGVRAAVASEESLSLLAVLGGWQGIAEAVIPPVAFLALYLILHTLWLPLAVAIACSLVLSLVRLVRKQSLQQALSGLVLTLISALVAWLTRNSSGFFLPGIIGNFVYGGAFVISALVKYPLLGLLWRLIHDDPDWRVRPEVMRPCNYLSHLWGVVYLLRGAVSLALFYYGTTAVLGGFRLATGLPVLALLVYITWARLHKIPRHATTSENEAA